MDERYDRDQLELALKAGNIPVDDNAIKTLDNHMFSIGTMYLGAFGYLCTGITIRPPSKELKNLNKAIKDFLLSENKEAEWRFQKPISAPISLEAFTIFSRVLSQYVAWLEHWTEDSLSKSRIETEVLIELYETYVELSGRKGLSDNGPGIRFITTCASILGMTVPQGMRRRIQIAIKRSQNPVAVPCCRNSGHMENSPEHS